MWCLQRLGVIGLGKYERKYTPQLVTLLEDVEWRSHSTYMPVSRPIPEVMTDHFDA
jgi:hypothetical protein